MFSEQNLYDLEGVFCPKSADKYQLLLKRDGFMSVLSKLKSKSKSSHLDAKRLGKFFVILKKIILVFRNLS